MLVKRDELPERLGIELPGEDRVRRTVALEHPVRHEPFLRALALDLLGSLAERQRLRLREDVRHQQIVVVADRIERPQKPMKSAGIELRPLVEQLVEGVLAVRAGLAPEDRAGLVVDTDAVERHRLAVRLHRQLLEVRGEPFQVLVVRQDGDGLALEEVRVPDREQAQDDRQVPLERRRSEVLVDRVEAGEHPAEVFRADGDHRREADRRVHRVAAADPIPELEHVRRVDAELRHFLGVRRDGHEVLRDRRLISQLRQQPIPSSPRVGERLQRRERLGRDDEERLLRVEVTRRFGDVGPVDVRDEPEGQIALRSRSEAPRTPSPGRGRSRRCRC